jgi:hypothetical protein
MLTSPDTLGEETAVDRTVGRPVPVGKSEEAECILITLPVIFIVPEFHYISDNLVKDVLTQASARMSDSVTRGTIYSCTKTYGRSTRTSYTDR